MPHEAAATRRVEEDQLLSLPPLQQHKMQRRDVPVVSLSLSFYVVWVYNGRYQRDRCGTEILLLNSSLLPGGYKGKGGGRGARD